MEAGGKDDRPATRLVYALAALLLALCVSASPSAAGTSIRVLHWNVKGGHRHIPTITREGQRLGRFELPPLNLDAVATVIAAEHPDVVGLDEICKPQLEELVQRLRRAGYRYRRHASLVTRGRCRPGVALLSKKPLLGRRVQVLRRGRLQSRRRDDPPDVPEWREIVDKPGLALASTISLGREPVQVVEFHAQGELQIPEALATIRRDASAVVACDCNNTRLARREATHGLYRIARSMGFTTTWRGEPLHGTSELDATYPALISVAWAPTWRPTLLYKPFGWHQADLIFARSRNGEQGLGGTHLPRSWQSDHWPVVTSVELGT